MTPLPEVPDERAWRPGGVYLITGGTGGLGLALARRLAPLGTRLALVGRTKLPEAARWDDWIATHGPDERISTILMELKQLQALGAEVLPVRADIGKADEVGPMLRAVREHFGELHGVVHAAGVPGAGFLQSKTREQAEAVLAPKILGTLAIADALRADPVELLVLYSSSVTVVGAVGETDYAAANAFLDAFAAAESATGSPDRKAVARKVVARKVVSVAWGAWQHDAWSSAAFEGAADMREGVRRYREEFGISDEDGTDALTRIVAAGTPQVLVLTQPLPAAVAQFSQMNSLDAIAGDDLPGTPTQRYPRPDLRVPYLAPRDATERRVADDVAGVPRHRAGRRVHDPFFELGGTSLDRRS